MTHLGPIVDQGGAEDYQRNLEPRRKRTETSEPPIPTENGMVYIEGRGWVDSERDRKLGFEQLVAVMGAPIRALNYVGRIIATPFRGLGNISRQAAGYEDGEF
jgi:hypothetical protein